MIFLDELQGLVVRGSSVCPFLLVCSWPDLALTVLSSSRGTKIAWHHLLFESLSDSRSLLLYKESDPDRFDLRMVQQESPLSSF